MPEINGLRIELCLKYQREVNSNPLSTRKLTTAQTAAFMAILTAGTKVLGFVREMVLAAFYGAGEVTDAYNMAQNIPNILLADIVLVVVSPRHSSLTTMAYTTRRL